MRYTQNLDKYLLPFASTVYACTWISRQDNASIHPARHTKDRFHDHFVNVMDQPARSLDLNPIENM